MKYLKVCFILSVALSLSSFVFQSKDDFNKKDLFKSFISEFNKVKLPNTLTLKSGYERVKKYEGGQLGEFSNNSIIIESVNNSSNVLGMDYVDFIPEINSGMMSRIGPAKYSAESLLASNKKYISVIYSESEPFNYTIKNYTLATFNNSGTLINAKHIGEASVDSYMEMSISKNMSFTINDISINQETNQNKVENTKKMFITPDGKILTHNI
ncbi:MAG: hypothetical protein MK207_10270 [Saprospiraceae bacterium]|nr:hypothetical protein [Saprospiraceae bacterium]